MSIEITEIGEILEQMIKLCRIVFNTGTYEKIETCELKEWLNKK